VLFYNTLSIACVIVYFKVSSQNMPGRLRKQVKNLSGYLPSVPRLEPWIFRIIRQWRYVVRDFILMVSRSTMRVERHSCVSSYLCHLPCIRGQAGLYHYTVRLCVYVRVSVCACVCVSVCVSISTPASGDSFVIYC